jgi:hypothetical protein
MMAPFDDDDDETRRGSGEPSAPAPTKDDCKLVDRALREGWPIPEEARQAMIRQLSAVVSEDGMITRKPRLFLACAKSLAGLSRINLSVVDTAIRAKQAEELEERVCELEKRHQQQGGDIR